MNIDEALKCHETASCLYDADEVDSAIAQLAVRAEQNIQNDFPLVLCVMNGGLFLTGQLMRYWNFPLTIDYVHATRYRLATLGRDVLWKAYPQNELQGRHVVIVDDIFDQGYTLQEVKAYCLKQGASKITSLFLIRKRHDRPRADIEADDVALECDDRYVYGSGMDLHSHFRNVSGIYAIPQSASGR